MLANRPARWSHLGNDAGQLPTRDRDRVLSRTVDELSMTLIPCPVCGIEFDTIAGLQAHLKTVHGQ